MSDVIDRNSIQLPNAEVGAIDSLAVELGELLERKGWTLSTAESCTGGLIAGAITDVAGSSNWFEQGIVAYANSVKQRLLGVQLQVLEQEGAVSEAVVLAMAKGARKLSGSDVAVSISGIAGPGGARAGKPVGTVWIGWSLAGRDASAQHFLFPGNRLQVRQSAVAAARRKRLWSGSRKTAKSLRRKRVKHARLWLKERRNALK